MNALRSLLPLLAALLAQELTHPQGYAIEKLPHPSPYAGASRATDLNEAGEVSGESDRLAVRWTASGVVNLTPWLPPGHRSIGRGISESGVVVGESLTSTQRGMLWIGAETVVLPYLGESLYSGPLDRNEAGLTVGFSGGGQLVATVWMDGAAQAIAGPRTVAIGVSETNDVAVLYYHPPSNFPTLVRPDRVHRAFRWRDGKLRALPALDRSGWTWAGGISPRGRIAGAAKAPSDGFCRPVVWEPDDTVRELAAALPIMSAKDVNDTGVAVGSAHLMGVGYHAYVWRGERAEDLNLLIPPGTDWHLETAVAVNDRGEIAAIGWEGGQLNNPFLYDSFLLRPDCDGDGVPDLAEIAAGTAHDANGDSLADACQHCQQDLGFAGPGAVRLSICGDRLSEAGAATLLVSGATAGAPVFVLAGSTSTPTPLFGGVLLPVPPAAITGPLSADPNGEVALALRSTGAPPSTMVVQAVALVGGQPHISNAVELQIGL